MTGIELLRAGANSFGLHLSEQQIDSFRTYLELIIFWNSRFNLTTIRESDRIIRLHFIDSLAIVPFIHPTDRLMDLGSGAGLPGVPLKIFYPQKPLCLVEAHSKKANFLKEVARKLHLERLQLVNGRAEDMNPSEFCPFNEVVARAFGPRENVINIAKRLLASGGRIVLMSGPSGIKAFNTGTIENQARKLAFATTRLEEYALPFGGEIRSVLVFTKS